MNCSAAIFCAKPKYESTSIPSDFLTSVQDILIGSDFSWLNDHKFC
jgi:hypothetical protein